MALGHTFYFKEYKNLSVAQLKRRLRNLQSPQHLKFLQRLRTEEINAKTDDVNAWTDHHTSIEVINLLIEYKTLYPNSDLSNWKDYYAIQYAVEQNLGAVEQNMKVSCNTENLTSKNIVSEGELPIMPSPPLSHPIHANEMDK